jgi:hypothetical protein
LSPIAAFEKQGLHCPLAEANAWVTDLRWFDAPQKPTITAPLFRSGNIGVSRTPENLSFIVFSIRTLPSIRFVHTIEFGDACHRSACGSHAHIRGHKLNRRHCWRTIVAPKPTDGTAGSPDSQLTSECGGKRHGHLRCGCAIVAKE